MKIINFERSIIFQMLRFNFFLVVLLAISACSKDDMKTQFSSRVIVENLPPVMGGFIGKNNELITFTLPILENHTGVAVYLKHGKVLSVNDKGQTTTLYTFNQSFTTGSYSLANYAGVEGYIASDAFVSLAMFKNEIISAHSKRSTIRSIENQASREFMSLQNVMRITNDFKGNLYFLTSPINPSGQGFLIPPKILQLDLNENLTEKFEFPFSNFEYNCGISGWENNMTPSDINFDIIALSENDFFVSLGYDHSIHQISNNQIINTINHIINPVSIDLDQFGRLFVLSAPTFKRNTENNIEVYKPLEVFIVENGITTKIFSDSKAKNGGCIKEYYDNIYLSSRTNYSLRINDKNQVFIQDPTLGRIILLE
jgi:hypothetical protein